MKRNLAEYQAAEIVATYFPERFEEVGEVVIWVEHYPRDEERRPLFTPEYSVTTFASQRPAITNLGGVQRLRLGQPRWSHLEMEQLTQVYGLDPNGLDDG